MFVLAGTHDVEAELWSGDDLPRGWFSWRKLWRFTGPGFLMSIGYIVSWSPASSIGWLPIAHAGQMLKSLPSASAGQTSHVGQIQKLC